MDKVYEVADIIRKRLERRSVYISNDWWYKEHVINSAIKHYLRDRNWLSLAKYKKYSYGEYIGMLDGAGKRQGMGAILYNDGGRVEIYVGEWDDDEANDDEGLQLQTDDGLYIGHFRNGVMHGRGYVHFPYNYSNEYEAEFENGKRKKGDGGA